MKLKSIILATIIEAVCLLTLTASAEDYNHVSGNHSWSMSCNKSGYVLQSQYPVSRFHEAGAGSSVTREKETLYLGRSFDALHTVMCDGKWCWANGGFLAEFDGDKMGFPRQELACPNSEDEFLGCQC
ncbi:hypothetical protein [Sneathiella sp.]|uniref:hypothetical protein n=1 Tax=Sneathiella sp. TaxID=1964365 RepID=UPI0035620D5B